MRAEELMSLIRSKPFTPLRLYMTDGRQYEVYHPDQILVLRQRVDIGVGADAKSGVADRVDHCSLLHIVRVEELAVPSPENN